MSLIERCGESFKKYRNDENWHQKPFQNSKGREVRGTRGQSLGLNMLCAPLSREEIVLYQVSPHKYLKKSCKLL